MRPKIGFIGAGKVGFSLGKLFSTSGVTVTGFYSRHLESAKEAAEFTGTNVYTSLEAIVDESDVLFLTVPDGEIAFLYESIKGMCLSDKQICHCSGVLSAKDAFPQIENTGAYGYSIHPLFPISSKLKSYRELSDAFFCIEGSGPHLSMWKELLEEIGPKVQIIDGERKIKYHAACAIASNLVCALMEESVSLLEESGFDRTLALEALSPLAKSNLEHILEDGPVNALTGPMERCDVGTIEKHLKNMDTDLEKTMYLSLSKKLLEISKNKNKERDYSSMEEMLSRF